MAANGNLSTLSRGLGAVRRNGHERIDVFLEPQEVNQAHNVALMFRSQGQTRPSQNRTGAASNNEPAPVGSTVNVSTAAPDIFAPIRPFPRQSFAPPSASSDYSIRKPSRQAPPAARRHHDVVVHKTYTTRRGALLLFSEELAEKLDVGNGGRRKKIRRPGALSDDDDDDDIIRQEVESLQTVDGLAWAVLNYGSKGPDSICLNFVRGRQTQVRPGFSAKRYLSRLTRSFDDSFLQRLISNGHIQEKTLFRPNELMPKLKRRINDDLSSDPTPYRVLKQMLISPGLLSGFSFYKEQSDENKQHKTSECGSVGEDGLLQGRGMKVVMREVKNGVTRTMSYGSLSSESKERALADLLVKSALGHALDQHQQNDSVSSVVDDFVSSAGTAQDNRKYNLTKSQLATVGQLDMMAAVKSYLESQSLADYDITVTPDGQQSERGDDVTSVDADDERSETCESSPRLPLATMPSDSSRRRRRQRFNNARDQMYHPMTPITDADSTAAMSREVTSFNQWTVLPAIPHHLDLPERQAEESDVIPANTQSTNNRKDNIPRQRQVHSFKGPVLFDVNLPADAATSNGSTVTSEQKQASKQTKQTRQAAINKLRRGNEGIGLGSDVSGSVLLLPGGEVMQIGQTVVPSSKTVTAEAAHQNLTDAEQGHIEQLIRRLSEHARGIASLVLTKPGTGEHIGHDAMMAAAMWTPSDVMSHTVTSFSPEQFGITAHSSSSSSIESSSSRQQLMTNDRLQSEPVDGALAKSLAESDLNGATLSAHRDLLASKLSSIVSQISESSSDSGMIKDASVSPELLEALLTQPNLKPQDICVEFDPNTGHQVISLRQSPSSVGQLNSMADDRRQRARNTKLSETQRKVQTKDSDSRKLASDQKKKKSDKDSGDELTSANDNKEALKSNGNAASKKAVEIKKSQRQTKKRKKKKTQKNTDEDTDATQQSEEPITAVTDNDNQVDDRPVIGDPSEQDGLSNEAALRRHDDEDDADDVSKSGEDREDIEFVIIKDEFPDDQQNDAGNSAGEVRQQKFLLSPLGLTSGSSGKDEGSESDSSGLPLKLSGREAREMRAAQRAAMAEKKRLENEQKRREREEQLKTERSEQIRREEMIRQLEAERTEREEARRIEREKREQERLRQEKEEEAREKKLRADAEREARQREEFAKKMAEMRAKQVEEDKKRRELENQRRLEEEEARKKEIEMLAQLEESERLEYLRKKREEEELRRKQQEEEKRRREEEQRLAMEEAVKLAQEIARQQEAQRQRLEFNRGLHEEAGSLSHMHEISRAFVFSYFELLQWLKLQTAGRKI